MKCNARATFKKKTVIDECLILLALKNIQQQYNTVI